jgi:hypothetical protein
MKLSLREKVFITVLLAVVFSWLQGCSREHYVGVPAVSYGVTDAAYLQHAYQAYNEGYFQNKLTQTPVIDMDEPNDSNMASTMCDESGNCIIHFNPKYVAAPRIGDQTLLHEMCHEKTWMQDMDSLGMQIDHGKKWRGCMLNLDMQGAFREIIIDGYAEQM